MRSFEAPSVVERDLEATAGEFQAQEPISILKLPVEVVWNIISWLRPRSGSAARTKKQKSAHHPSVHSLKALRLTCKSLARLLLPVLMSAVNVSCNSSARDFLTWCTNYASEGHHQIPVRRLTIRNVARPSFGNGLQLVHCDVFEEIVMVLAPSLHQLKIEFKDCFEFSNKLALGFRKAKQVWVLHLSVITDPPADPTSPPTPTPGPSESGCSQLYDPHPLFRSLMSLPNLVELDLGNCFDFCMPLDANFQLTSFPRVQHLSASFDQQSTSFPSEPHKALFFLCRAIANSILIFEIKGSRYDPTKLLPILSITQGHLEALHLSEIALVKECNGLKFPRLRTLEIDDSRYLVGEEFNSPLFEHVTTLLVRKWSASDLPLDIPVETFRNLRRVILTYTPCLTPDNIPLLNSCQASSVDLLSTAKSIDLREIWAIDAMAAYAQRMPA